MAKTIIQTIGPLYGEVVNGTVFGRPNGSIYVPISNSIKITVPSETYVRKDSRYATLCDSAGLLNTGKRYHVVAESQDSSAYMSIQLSDSSDFETYYVTNLNAGIFNSDGRIVGILDDDTITDGTTYYLRAQLMSSTGVAVATSDVVEIIGLVMS